jgi:hypothetical protein
MTTSGASTPHRPALVVIVLALVAAVGLLLGFYGAIFGPWYPMVLGAVVAVVGVILVVRSAPWGRVLLTWGVAVILGAALYVVIGVLTPDAAGSGSGSGCVPGAVCDVTMH